MQILFLHYKGTTNFSNNQTLESKFDNNFASTFWNKIWFWSRLCCSLALLYYAALWLCSVILLWRLILSCACNASTTRIICVAILRALRRYNKRGRVYTRPLMLCWKSYKRLMRLLRLLLPKRDTCPRLLRSA